MDKFINTSDWHLREDKPLCFIGTDRQWMEAQENAINFIVDEANFYNADIIHNGDLYNTPRVAPAVSNMFLRTVQRLRGRFYIIAGNHCLPWHKQENLMDSSIGALSAQTTDTSKIVYLTCQESNNAGRFEHSVALNDEILIVHTLAFPTAEDIPFGANAVTGKNLLDKYKEYNTILVGDYHEAFQVHEGSRHLINPGCMMIQAADMIKYQPRIAYVDYGADLFMWIDIPTDYTLLSDNHLVLKAERDSRIKAFVETIKKNGKLSLSFIDNLDKFLLEGNLDQDVLNIFIELKGAN